MRRAVSIPDELWRQTKARAALDNVNVSVVLQNALEAFLTTGPTREPLQPNIKKGVTMTVIKEPTSTIVVEPAEDPRPTPPSPAPVAGFNSRPFTPVPKKGK